MLSIERRIWAVGTQTVDELRGRHLLLVWASQSKARLTHRNVGRQGTGLLSEGLVTFLPGATSWMTGVIDGCGVSTTIAIPVEMVTTSCGETIMDWRHAFGERHPRIIDAANWLATESSRQPEERHELVRHLLARLLAAAFAGFARRADDGWLPASALGRIESLVATGDPGSLSLHRLAAEAGLGVSAFSRGFRGSTGITPGDYLVDARMTRIAALLADTDLPMLEIARQVGLSSIPHMSEQFRSRFGISMSRYRTARRAKASDEDLLKRTRMAAQLVDT